MVLAVGVSQDVALAGATRKLARDLLVLGLVALGALGLALVAAHVFVVRPIEALATAARRLGSGDRGTRAGNRRAPRELRELARTFDEMAASLQRREDTLRQLNDELEQRVAERTAELEAVNEELSHQVTVNRTVLDATADAIALTDLEGNLLVVNAAATEMLERLGVQPGAAPDDVAGQAALGSADPEAFAAEVAANRADPDRESVYEYELAAGGRWFRSYSGPVRDGSGAVVARIYTAREVTADRLADRLKSELVATVSHELRTPLASILGFAELLSERELDDETRRRYLGTVCAEARRLTALVNDFLDLQRIEAGSFTPTFRALTLDDVLREQVDLFSAQSAAHELELEVVAGPLGVVADGERIAQVIGNLLSNAIKYSPAGGTVRVRAEARDDAVRVTVTDEGVGIPPSQHEKLFTKFFRVDSSDTREIGGTGLGLALAREIVHAHHGEMGFESAPGEGSSFWFELPAVRRGASGGRRVLIVEDDPAAAALIAEHLGTNGFEVEIVATGEDALERVSEDPPILVSLDVVLAGELDGWQVLTSLKTHPRSAGIPVIVCTAGNGRRQAAALGADEFLVKPFSGARLRELVRQLVPHGDSVLVADDDGAIRTLVREALAPDGVEVLEAADGAEALALLRAEHPDALVLDLVMPDVDGFSVLAELQNDPELRDVPVVVLTGKDLSETERSMLRMRADAVLQKEGTSPEQLRRRVASMLARAAAR